MTYIDNVFFLLIIPPWNSQETSSKGTIVKQSKVKVNTLLFSFKVITIKSREQFQKGKFFETRLAPSEKKKW